MAVEKKPEEGPNKDKEELIQRINKLWRTKPPSAAGETSVFNKAFELFRSLQKSGQDVKKDERPSLPRKKP